MSLEQWVEAGMAAYIESLIYDTDASILRINFMRAETWTVYGTLTFVDVRGFHFDFDSQQDETEFRAGIIIEGLIGIQEMGAETDPNYLLQTDVREISFRTDASPIWSLIGMGMDTAQ